MVVVTGNETVGIFECAKLVVNNQFEQTGFIAVMAVVLLFVYVFLIYQFWVEKQMKKFMKAENVYDKYLLWKEHRKD